jgi:hypothetical protein
MPGQQAVLSALGARTLRPNTLLSDGLREILGAMEASGVSRILWESALGVGETRALLGPLFRWFLIPFLLRHVYADKERPALLLAG